MTALVGVGLVLSGSASAVRRTTAPEIAPITTSRNQGFMAFGVCATGMPLAVELRRSVSRGLGRKCIDVPGTTTHITATIL